MLFFLKKMIYWLFSDMYIRGYVNSRRKLICVGGKASKYLNTWRSLRRLLEGYRFPRLDYFKRYIECNFVTILSKIDWGLISRCIIVTSKVQFISDLSAAVLITF